MARARFLCAAAGGCDAGSVMRRFLERVLGPLRVLALWAVVLEERDCCPKFEREGMDVTPGAATDREVDILAYRDPRVTGGWVDADVASIVLEDGMFGVKGM